MTTGLKLLTAVWKNGMRDSWGRINHSMRSALCLVIGSGLDLSASDLDVIWNRFRAEYWIGSEPEWVYTMAVVVGNVVVQEAWEKHNKFAPFRANKVSDPRYGSGEGYIHANSIKRQREKLAVGFGVVIDDRQWWVTRIETECVRMASYKKDYPEGKPVKLRKFSREELQEIFPASEKKTVEA